MMERRPPNILGQRRGEVLMNDVTVESPVVVLLPSLH